MNLNSVLGSFVKFVRGTPTAYNNLQQKNPDTLYFIAENGAPSGKLYLGNKLIGGSVTGATSLSELVDIFLDNNLSVNNILVYEGNRWINKDIRDVFEMSIGTMVGATDETDGVTGLVPAPQAGQQDGYLRGNGEWDNPISTYSEQIHTMIDEKLQWSTLEEN
ncbi:MAG: hypothetical protein J6W64_05725 [Bacilli bacterium]|nr:hypothetical protein [Bacilli bacterium]